MCNPGAGSANAARPSSGRLYTRMDDGSDMEFGPGDLLYVPPGHDGWTVGNEPVVFLQIEGAAKYAKK